MSEMNNGNFQVPAEQSFDTESFQGSMQQVLQDNLGSYVSVDFLIGTQNFITKQGVLFWVGSQFIVLYEEANQQYVVCDIFAIKFVTFFLPGHRPGQVPQTPAAPVYHSDPAMTPAQAAYAHATRSKR
ncbi:MAG: hypothetical protein IKK21_11530 [Clostridia bacterium]|nr:hypothetical protein [Clostridia bacterium]